MEIPWIMAVIRGVTRRRPGVTLAACVLSLAMPRPLSQDVGRGITPFIIRSYLSSNLPPSRPPVATRLSGISPGNDYSGKCMDFASISAPSGSPVFISDCNGGPSQEFGVEDVSVPIHFPNGLVGFMHKAVLHAADKCVGTLNNKTVVGAPLVLQDCLKPRPMLLKLDGDSIIIDADHSYVAEVKDGFVANRTPVVLGLRELSDIEFWSFDARDGSKKLPTAAFFSVSDPGTLASVLQSALPGAVIEIASMEFREHRLPPPGSTPPGLILVPEGVTIRGGRRGLDFGPEISFTSAPSNGSTPYTLFQIIGDDVRITGLRIKGPSRDAQGGVFPARGIWAGAGINVDLIIDHNDMSDWTRAAIDLFAGDMDDSKCPGPPPSGHPLNARIARNFIHHNEQQAGDGYGVAVGADSHALIDANLFVTNMHSVTSDGAAKSFFSATHNLILADVPRTGGGHFPANFDIHGSGPGHDGGIAGSGGDVFHNTFLGTQNLNFDVRGAPCPGWLARFQSNISIESAHDAIQWQLCSGSCEEHPNENPPASNLPAWFQINGNFNSRDPTAQLGVGDFDGDGKDDLFLATGEGWYYSPGGKADWRFLSAKTEAIGSLLFGDFDGDGRTDVFTQIGDDWMVSWGGISPWQEINHSQWRMKDFVIGDFVGDRRADVFFARGDQWFVSDGGVGPFLPFATASQKITELRFGDFDGDKKTDVLAIMGGQFQVVLAKPGPQNNRLWRPLRSATGITIDSVFVADFDGSGIADIAFRTKVPAGRGFRYAWKVCKDGTGGPGALSPYLNTVFRPVGIGNFDDRPGVDILFWEYLGPRPPNGTMEIVSSGLGTQIQQSRQDMR
jgi:hypothetical protein